jgi:hypothetical protein
MEDLKAPLTAALEMRGITFVVRPHGLSTWR